MHQKITSVFVIILLLYCSLWNLTILLYHSSLFTINQSLKDNDPASVVCHHNKHCTEEQTQTGRPVILRWDAFPSLLPPSRLLSPPLSVPPINFVACPESQQFCCCCFTLYLLSERTASFFSCHLTGKKRLFINDIKFNSPHRNYHSYLSKIISKY